MSIGLCVVLSILSFIAGEFAVFFTMAIFLAGKERDNDDKQ